MAIQDSATRLTETVSQGGTVSWTTDPFDPVLLRLHSLRDRKAPPRTGLLDSSSPSAEDRGFSASLPAGFRYDPLVEAALSNKQMATPVPLRVTQRWEGIVTGLDEHTFSAELRSPAHTDVGADFPY